MKFSELKLLELGNTIHLVGAIYADAYEEQLLLCFFPGDGGEVTADRPIPVLFYPNNNGETEWEVETLNMTSDEWNQFLRQSDLMETEVLAHAEDGTVCKAILRKSARQIGQDVSWQVFKRDGYTCRYCGRDDVPLTVDHLVLWEHGGPSTPENLTSSCKSCNKKRGNLPYDQWLEHPFYKRVSANLTEEQRAANRRLLDTLGRIPRVLHKRSKR